MNTKVAKKQNNKGFTLIELIVVIAIIAVLAAILAPQYLRYVEKSRVSSDEQYANELRNAVKTTCAEESAAQDVKTGDAIKWDKNGLSGKITVANDSTVATSNDTGFAKELKTNLSGEKITAPKSRKYKDADYLITLTVANDAISVEGKWEGKIAS